MTAKTKVKSKRRHRAITPKAYGDAYQHGLTLTIRFLCSRGVPEDSAEEAAQAAWVKGWERRAALRNPRMIVAWVNTIALNLFRNRIRKENRHEALTEMPQSPRIKAAVIDVRRSLDRCRAAERTLLTQRYVEGYTSAELARSRGCRPVAVRVRLLRARRKLRTMLSAHGARGSKTPNENAPRRRLER